jgi:hypothetical protein
LRYFVLGCDDLILAVDLKPLLKIFSDRSLEDISNSRLRNYLTVSESREDTADMMILFSMPVTSDSESEVCMPDKSISVSTLKKQGSAIHLSALL